MGGDGSDGRFKSAMDKLLQLEALTTHAARYGVLVCKAVVPLLLCLIAQLDAVHWPRWKPAKL